MHCSFGLRNRRLANGFPGWRTRRYAEHLHRLGPRMLLDFIEALITGEISGEAAITARLERYADLKPWLVGAIGGRELPSPVFDPSWCLEGDRKLELKRRHERERRRAHRRRDGQGLEAERQGARRDSEKSKIEEAQR
jgi:hypothetical protein